MTAPTLTALTEAGDEIAIPARFEVCPRCRGAGSHVNPAIDGNGLSADDFDEAGDEFRDDYMRGVYDVPCHECNGQRVVAVVDLDRCNDEQRAAWASHERAMAEADRDEYSERFLRQAEGGW